jgi:pyruvyltransferase
MKPPPVLSDPAVRTLFFDRVANVGDRISPLVVGALSGRRVEQATDLTRPHLLAVGSLMARSTRVSQVWGTGVIDPAGGIGGVKAANVRAVRGQLTRQALRDAGVSIGDAPLGDPAFLAPALLGVSRAAAAPTPIGLVRHYLDRDSPLWARWTPAQGVADLDVGAAPELFLAQMAQCAVVVSTSLHGLVFAEALGIPSLWLMAGDRLIGGAFKFHDWFSTTRRPQTTAHALRVDDEPGAVARRAEIRESAIDTTALIAAFPHHRLEELSGRMRPRPFGGVPVRATTMAARAIRARRRPDSGR